MKRLIIFLTCITYLPILINQGIFWDDWKIFKMSEAGIEEQFWGTGSFQLISSFHFLLQKTLNPVLVYHSLTILFSLLTAYLFYLIIGKLNLTSQQRKLTLIFFLINPFFSAKITMICLPYTLSLLLFVLAFYLFILSTESRGIVYRLLSLILFFFSFVTNSLLLFFVIVPIYLCKDLVKFNIGEISKRILRYGDYLVLPLIFWGIKLIWFQPQGLYKLGNYNQITIEKIALSPVRLMISLKEIFTGFFGIFFYNFNILIFITLILLIALLIYKGTQRTGEFSVPNTKQRSLLLPGAFLFIIAIIPYALVGKFASFYGYDTRNQILLPFGFSLLLASAFSFIKNRPLQLSLLVFLISTLTFVNLQQQFHYMVGWFKQEAIIAHFEKTLPQNINTIEVNDSTQAYSPTQEPILFFEWNGMAKSVRHNEKRLFLTKQLFNVIPPKKTLKEYIIFFRKNRAVIDHNMSDYFPDGVCHTLIVTPTDNRLDDWATVINLTYKYYSEQTSFRREISDYINIRFDATCSNELKAILK